MSAALCIDIGGTNLRAGLATLEAAGAPEKLGHWRAPATLEDFRERIGGLLKTHRASRLGIAIPGLTAGTKCVWVPNLPFLDDTDLADLFPDTEIALGNDAQFALLAEVAQGAAHDIANAILIAIGTGIGSAVLADGRIVRGDSGSAASFGWACADPQDAGDNVHGWLERQVSGTALDAIARSAGLANGTALIAAARGGDREATEYLMAPSAALGAALSGAVALLGSCAIVVSGGVAESLDVLGPLVEDVLRRQLPPHKRDVSLVAGKFGPHASLIGAALAAHGHPVWSEGKS